MIKKSKALILSTVLLGGLVVTTLTGCGETNPEADKPAVVKTGTIVLEKGEGGDVILNKTKGKVGETVPFIVVPDNAHTIESVFVNDIEADVSEDGKCSIEIEEGENTIVVSFAAKETEGGGDTETQTGTITLGTFVNGTVTVVEPKDTYNVGDTVTLTVTPNTNYVASEVKNNDTVITPVNGVYTFTIVAGTNTITATFTKESTKAADIVIETVTNGTITVKGNKLTGNVGDSREVTFKPNDGYKVKTNTAKHNTNVLQLDENNKATIFLAKNQNKLTCEFELIKEPVTMKTFYISTPAWFNSDEAMPRVKPYGANDTPLFEGNDGYAATYTSAYDELNERKYWTVSIPEDTLKAQIFRYDPTPDTFNYWNSKTVLFDLSGMSEGQNTFIVDNNNVSGDQEAPVTFGTVDPENIVPSLPSLGEYTINLRLGDHYRDLGGKPNNGLFVYVDRAFDGTQNVPFPGTQVDLNKLTNKDTFTFKVNAKASTRFQVFLCYKDNGTWKDFEKTSFFNIPFDRLGNDKDLEVTLYETNKFGLKDLNGKIFVDTSKCSFWDDSDAVTGYKAFTSPDGQEFDFIKLTEDEKKNGFTVLDKYKKIIITRTNPANDEIWSSSYDIMIDYLKTNGYNTIELFQKDKEPHVSYNAFFR